MSNLRRHVARAVFRDATVIATSWSVSSSRRASSCEVRRSRNCNPQDACPTRARRRRRSTFATPHSGFVSFFLPPRSDREFVPMKKNLEINWKSKPEKEDYASAKEYLALLYDEKKAAKLVSRLKKGRTTTFASKDIFRASHLPLLDISNAQDKADHKKIVGNKKLAPPLLVRHDTTAQTIIADGYHRLCAAYSFDEDAPIPCKIV